MTPGDLDEVRSSWSVLRRRRAEMVDALTSEFEAMAPSSPTAPTSAVRATWLFDAVAELVGLLVVPSRLGDRARSLAETWPDPQMAPSYCIDGRAWMRAAATCQAGWVREIESAWQQAWRLLSDVLAAETLSPFADCPSIDAGAG